MINNKFFLYYLHLVLVILADTSWFWLDFRLVLIGVLFLYLQEYLLGSCIITKAQYADKGSFDKDETFVWHVLNDVGLRLDKNKVAKVNKYYLPLFILILALIYQVFLGFRPIISL